MAVPDPYETVFGMRNLAVCAAWLLLSACAATSGRDQTGDFRHFIREFFRDEEFQLAHVDFPVTVLTWTGESDVQTSSISRAEWVPLKGPAFYDCEQSCYDIMMYDGFSKTQDATGERVLAFEGISNGINSSLYFRLMGDRWMLVKVEDFDH